MNLTDRQKQLYDLIKEDPSISNREVGRRIGISESAVRRHIDRINVKFEKAGADPGFSVKGKTTLYGPDGETKLEWVKTEKAKEELEQVMRRVVDGFKDQIKPAKRIKPSGNWQKDLLNLHILTDFHIGMYSWPEETGQDWNLEIAEELAVKWLADAIRRSPKAETGVLAQLGDFLHYDSMVPVTPTGQHIQDTDSRYAAVVRTAIRIIRQLIMLMLKKYKTVHLLNAEGNHDMSSSVWLRELFATYYDKEPRVIVDQTVDPYYVIEHGDTSLFFHHGHKRKPANVDSVFVGRNREIYGRTKFSYAHLGHMHSIDTKETNLMIVEQHRTLAARDAYATRGGWTSGRSAGAITYHKSYGEISRITTSYEMVKHETT